MQVLCNMSLENAAKDLSYDQIVMLNKKENREKIKNHNAEGTLGAFLNSKVVSKKNLEWHPILVHVLNDEQIASFNQEEPELVNLIFDLKKDGARRLKLVKPENLPKFYHVLTPEQKAELSEAQKKHFT